MTDRRLRVPNFSSTQQVAEQLGVSTKTVGRWIKAGDLRVHRLGRQLRIADDDLIAFVATRRG